MKEVRPSLDAELVASGPAVGVSARTEADTRLDLRAVLAILRRRARLALVTIAVVIGAALLFLAQTTPRYTATTLLVVDPAEKDLLWPGENLGMAGSFSSAAAEIDVEILQSNAVLLALISEKDLVSDPEFGPALSAGDKLWQALGAEAGPPEGSDLVTRTIDRVRGAIEARRRGLTDLVALSFTSRDPARAAELANELAAQHIALQVRAKSQAYLDATQVLQGQLAAAQSALAASETALARYIDENLDRLERESGSEAVVELRRRLDAASAARASAALSARSADAALQGRNWEALADELNVAAVRALLGQRDALARKLGTAGPEVEVDLRARLAGLDRALLEESTAAVAVAHRAVADQQQTVRRLRESLRDEVLSGDLSAETVSQLYGLQQEATIAQRQYDTLLSRIRELQAQALVQVADTRIVSPAIVPSSPSYPNTRLVLSLATVAALGLGIGLALLSEYYVGGIHSEAQLANSTGTKVAAAVPVVSQAGRQLSVADTVIDAPMSPFAESLRRLRAGIDRFSRQPTDGARVIMIASALPLEGKSSTALALARTYALAGKKTLLIDADLRKPSLHLMLGVDPLLGLYEYLDAANTSVTAEECYEIDPLAPLGVVFGRNRPDAPTDALFQSNRFRALIEDARESFDIVIIDTPPLSPVVDARYVATLSDSAVLCVRAGDTGQTEVRHALEQLTDHLEADAAVMTVLTFAESPGRAQRYAANYYG